MAYQSSTYPFAQALQAMMLARERERQQKEQSENNVVGGLQTLANSYLAKKQAERTADEEAKKLVAKSTLEGLMSGKMIGNRKANIDVSPNTMRGPLDLNTTDVAVGSKQPYSFTNDDLINFAKTGQMPSGVSVEPVGERPKTGRYFNIDPKTRQIKFTEVLTGGEENKPLAFGPSSEFNPNSASGANLAFRMKVQHDKLVQDFNNINTSVLKIENEMGRVINENDPKKKQALDQELLYTFNKTLDPASVVMVSEFARTTAGQDLISKIRGYAEKLKTGGVGLTDETRKELLNAMKGLRDSSANYYKMQRENSANFARTQGFDENTIQSIIGQDYSTNYGKPETGTTLTPEKQKRLAELRAKKAAGKLR